MKKLQEAAYKYAEEAVDQSEGISIEMLKGYAREDFRSGADWYKFNSKTPEMLEMLKSCLLAFQQLGIKEPENIKQLIKEATELC